MGRAFQQYNCNGWEIRYSDYLKKWELNPIFRGENSDSKYDNFYNNEFIVFKTLKEGEELNDKLSVHNWFLPSIGDLARIYWYHRQGYDATTENAIFAKPMSETGFTQFSSSSHWSSTEYSSTYSWYVFFSDGYISNGYKCISHVVRPCVAF